MTLELQYKQFLKHNPDSTFSFKEWMKWHSHQMEQAIIQMMQDDEELGLYDYDWCKGNVVLPREEIKLEDVFNNEKREGIKKFIDEVKSITDNKYDVYNWIIKVIDSCKNYHHFRAVDNLITNFYDKYDDWQLTGKLRGYSSDKYYNRKTNEQTRQTIHRPTPRHS